MEFLRTGLIVGLVIVFSGSGWANPSSGFTVTTTESPTPSLMPSAASGPPVQLIVSLSEQRMEVYVGGKLTAVSPVSTGQAGHTTPTGIFSVLQKRKFHRSNIYSQAPMPFMQRLTWSGIALHASDHVPDYPASHGCVRLPETFAEQLFGITDLGAHVVITGAKSPAPREISGLELFRPRAERASEVLLSDAGKAGRTPIVDAGLGEIPLRGSLVPPTTVNELEPESVDLGQDVAAADQSTAIAVASSTADVAHSSKPLRILITRRNGRERVRDAQTLLKELGFDPGEIDGWMGRDTGRAISRFQKSRGLARTGAMSSELVDELYRAAGRGTPPAGHIYVRQDFKPLFDAPVEIENPALPLGTHLLTALDIRSEPAPPRWLAVSPRDEPSGPTTLPDGVTVLLGSGPVETAGSSHDIGDTLGRFVIPEPIIARISQLLTPGSSVIISDSGIGQETLSKGTDFVVLTP